METKFQNDTTRVVQDRHGMEWSLLLSVAWCIWASCFGAQIDVVCQLTNADGFMCFGVCAGIWFVSTVNGSFMYFDIQNFIVQMSAFFSLLAIATFVVDFLMMYVVPERVEYKAERYSQASKKSFSFALLMDVNHFCSHFCTLTTYFLTKTIFEFQVNSNHESCSCFRSKKLGPSSSKATSDGEDDGSADGDKLRCVVFPALPSSYPTPCSRHCIGCAWCCMCCKGRVSRFGLCAYLSTSYSKPFLDESTQAGFASINVESPATSRNGSRRSSKSPSLRAR